MTRPRVVDLAVELHQSGQTLFLGHHEGRPTYGNREDHVVVLGPPRSGKSSAIFAPSIAVHPGPVIVTSTRAAGIHADLRDVSIRARKTLGQYAGKGRVFELYLDEAIPPLLAEGSVPVGWSVSSGCESWNNAVERARSLAGAAIPLSEQNAQYWRSVCATFVAPLLHCAALCGWDDSTMLEWASLSPATSELEHEVVEQGSYGDVRNRLSDYYQNYGAHASVRWCDDILNASLEVQQNVRHVAVSQIFGYLSFDLDLDVEPFDIDEFLDAWSTLYITVRPQRSEQYRTLIAAFVDAVASRWQARKLEKASGTLLLALDEVANIAPIATLPELIAAGGGSGIQVMLGFQGPGQARRRWGDEGVETVVRGPTHTVIFPAMADRQFLDDTAALFGEEDRHIFDVTADTREAGEVVARDLILLRQQMEKVRETFKHAPAMAERQILVRIAMPYAQRARLAIGLGHADVSPEAVVADVMKRTRVTERVERRPRLTGAEVYGGMREAVFVVSRAPGTRLPSFSFRKAVGWYVDEFWKGVLS